MEVAFIDFSVKVFKGILVANIGLKINKEPLILNRPQLVLTDLFQMFLTIKFILFFYFLFFYLFWYRGLFILLIE